MKSNSNKLLGGGNHEPIEIEDAPIAVREESDDDAIDLDNVPTVESADADDTSNPQGSNAQRSKRARQAQESSSDSEDQLFVPQDSPPAKRQKGTPVPEADDDKKKMAMDMTYDGFSIYGRVLCLVVKQRDNGKGRQGLSGGQAMMEDWITSTQMPQVGEDGT
jgi:hypothetical protein